MPCKNQKPHTIRISIIILIFKIISFVVIIAASSYVLNQHGALEGIFEGIKDILEKNFQLEEDYISTFNMGKVLGSMVLPIIMAVIGLILVYTRKYYLLLLGLVVAQIAFTFYKIRIPIAELILLILLSQNSARDYFEKGNYVYVNDILDDFE